MEDLGARSEGAFAGLGALVMNLRSDDKTAKIDCWLTGCRRHCRPSLRLRGYDDSGHVRVIEQGQCRECTDL